MDPERRIHIIQEARSWLGTPYHHKGRIKGVGVDCGGLLYEVYGKFMPLGPYPEYYAEDWALHQDNNEIYLEFMKPYTVPWDAPVPGGIAVFRYGRAFSHGAIISEKGTFIHSFGRTGRGKVLESTRDYFVENNMSLRKVKYFDMRMP